MQFVRRSLREWSCKVAAENCRRGHWTWCMKVFLKSRHPRYPKFPWLHDQTLLKKGFSFLDAPSTMVSYSWLFDQLKAGRCWSWLYSQNLLDSIIRMIKLNKLWTARVNTFQVTAKLHYLECRFVSSTHFHSFSKNHISLDHISEVRKYATSTSSSKGHILDKHQMSSMDSSDVNKKLNTMCVTH